MRKNEDGTIALETCLAFIPLIIMVMAIVSLVDVSVTQAKMHYALTQTANTVSMYGYVMEPTGIADSLKGFAKKHDEFDVQLNEVKGNITDIVDAISNLPQSAMNNTSGIEEATSTAGTAGTALLGTYNKIVEDPKAIISLFLNSALDEGQQILFQALVKPLVIGYLEEGSLSGEEYLIKAGIVNGAEGLSFDVSEKGNYEAGSSNDSKLIDANGDLTIVLNYKIAYRFGMFIPFDTDIEITQMVKTKMFLGGVGDGYE